MRPPARWSLADLPRALAALCRLAVLCWAVGAAAPAWAMIVTPGISAGVGYDDNIRLRQEARADTFMMVSPSLRLEAGDPAHRFIAEGGVDYAYYTRYSQYTRVESGRATARYHKEFSGATKLDLYNNYFTTYDPAELGENGDLVRVNDTENSRTTNTTGLSLRHGLGPISYIYTDIQYVYGNGTGASDEELNSQRGLLRWLQALTPSHHLQLDLTGSNDQWETSPDLQQTGGSASWYWLLDQRKTVSLAGGFNSVRAKGDDSQINQARDYDVYWTSVGFDHRYSPVFEWSVNLGWSYVTGEARSNAAAGSGYPTAQARAKYTQPRWSLEVYAKSSLDEYDVVGDNSGLTKTQAAGARWQRALARHWRLTLFADYIRDDYQQDPLQADTNYNRGVINTTRLGGLLSWEVLRDLTMNLDYRYLDRDAEDDDQDRSQNRVLLRMDYRYPMLW